MAKIPTCLFYATTEKWYTGEGWGRNLYNSILRPQIPNTQYGSPHISHANILISVWPTLCLLPSLLGEKSFPCLKQPSHKSPWAAGIRQFYKWVSMLSFLGMSPRTLSVCGCQTSHAACADRKLQRPSQKRTSKFNWLCSDYWQAALPALIRVIQNTKCKNSLLTLKKPILQIVKVIESI